MLSWNRSGPILLAIFVNSCAASQVHTQQSMESSHPGPKQPTLYTEMMSQGRFSEAAILQSLQSILEPDSRPMAVFSRLDHPLGKNPQPTRISLSNEVYVPSELNQQQESTVPEGHSVVEFYRGQTETVNDPLRLSDEVVPYPVTKVERLRPLLELGDPFLGNGPIRPGIKTPTGQMLQPWFLLFGTFRSAIQTSDNGNDNTAEWSNRLDLHGNLNLSGTERLLFSMRPLDRDSGESTGFNFNPKTDDGWQQTFNGELTTVFFEGELGEIFPGLDPADSSTLDWGFSVGRQPAMVQDGLLLNDTIDLVGISRNSLTLRGVPNLNLIGIFGWNDIDRGNSSNDDAVRLFGFFSTADTAWESTISMDLIYVDDKDTTNAWYFGAGSTQRFGMINTTFRINTSYPEHGDTPVANRGTILSSELSGTLQGSDNIIYFNSFLSIDNFTSAARGQDKGTPLANLGILFGPVGMGRYEVPLGQPIADTVGTTLGYQMFLDSIRSQLILELGARTGTKSSKNADILGFGVRYQQAIGTRYVLRFDSFLAAQEGKGLSHGVRQEWVVKF